MPTIEEMLMIGAATDEDKARMQADALRGKRRAASAFSLSTVPEIAGAAKQQNKDVMRAAERGGALRQAAVRDAEDLRRYNLNRSDRLAKEKEDRALKKAIAGMKDKGPMSGMSAATKKKYIAADTIDKGFEDLIRRVEENEGAFGLISNPTTMLPDLTPNILSKPLKAWQTATKTDAEQQIANDVFKNAYDIIHALAGATLAAGEEDKISKFAPMPEDNARTIKNKLRSALNEARRSKAVMENLTGSEGASEIDISGAEFTGETQRRPAGVGRDWNLMEDANGNRAWVGPSGDFVEVD